MKKGQFLRLFLDDEAIAAATSCSLHVSAQLEDSTTKDTEGDWADNEVVGLSWDASSESLVLTDNDGANNLENLMHDITNWNAESGETFKLDFCQTGGTKNREVESLICTGNCLLTELTVTAQNRQNSTVSCKFSGLGALSLGTEETTTP